MNEMVIGIVGGNGRMGQFFKRIFKEDGIVVIVSDLGTTLSNCEVAQLADIVIVSVPLNKTIEVITELLPVMTKEKLFMDVSSLKVEPVKAMLASQADVIGMHPMFDPLVNSIAHQTLLLTPARDRNGWLETISSYFQKKQAKLKVLSPEAHDKLMAYAQLLIHFNTLILGLTITALGLDIQDVLDYVSPLARISLDSTGRLLHQSGNLYRSIFMDNPEKIAIIQAYLQTTTNISALVLESKYEEFLKLFEKAGDHFSDFKLIATEESNYLIDKLVAFYGKEI